MSMQMALFDVLSFYEGDKPLSNQAVYDKMRASGVVRGDDLEQRTPVGAAGQPHNLAKRQFRWWQQSLKALGLLERVPGERGVWRAVRKDELTPAPSGVRLLGFSTRLGLCIWGNCEEVLKDLDEPITAVITSPPYPLRQARAYGGPQQHEYTDFIVSALEPLVRRLRPGGTIALNISNDCFMPGSPARSLYRERLILALHDKLGLHKLDEIPWVNDSKPPGPIQWASKQRMQLNVSWEPIYLLTNDPLRSLCDNRRVLQPHTDRQIKLLKRGGEQRIGSFGDGAYTLKHGSFGRETDGRIPKNTLRFGHRCPDLDRYREYCRSEGFASHGAAMPLKLVRFLVEYLAAPGDLVVDPFGGTQTTGKACEETLRRWVSVERMLQYLMGSASRFFGADGFQASW